ncbi:FAD:protein FMN transferase [Nonomuraea composti]|uniref:FAD:protein FMN transferase n=1 Tax=Nonomuraea composti TaxID=2720023 RepID=UPI00197D96F3|nr:FAD:protein FMN transferase [Nonomuraea sp. FMUSA5-5]
MRHVEHAMGTVFSFDLRPPLGDARRAVAEAVTWLHRVDAIFSPYREDSPMSRLGRGEIGLDDCPPEVTEVLDLCAAAAEASGGYSSTRPAGLLDPSALVKGWAVEQASRMLVRHGAVNHCLNGGGDIQCAGRPAPDRPWRIAVAHPQRPGITATVVSGQDLAVATSGTVERGPHIIDPHTGRPARELASITITITITGTGTGLTMVDAYATAAFAMGGRPGTGSNVFPVWRRSPSPPPVPPGTPPASRTPRHPSSRRPMVPYCNAPADHDVASGEWTHGGRDRRTAATTPGGRAGSGPAAGRTSRRPGRDASTASAVPAHQRARHGRDCGARERAAVTASCAADRPHRRCVRCRPGTGRAPWS